MSDRLSTLAVALASLLAAPVFADYVVLESDAALFGIGALLADDTNLRLAEGERIVLVAESGDVLEIHGPYSGPPVGDTPQDIDVRDALTNLIENADNLHASLGSTRGGITLGKREKPRDAWQLDAFRSGRQCVVAGNAVELWRADISERLTLEIQRPGVEGTASIDWHAGEAEVPWPATLPITNDALYVLRRSGWTEAAMIHVLVLEEAVIRHRQAAIAWLAAHGCRSQAELLMSQLD